MCPNGCASCPVLQTKPNLGEGCGHPCSRDPWCCWRWGLTEFLRDRTKHLPQLCAQHSCFYHIGERRGKIPNGRNPGLWMLGGVWGMPVVGDQGSILGFCSITNPCHPKKNNRSRLAAVCLGRSLLFFLILKPDRLHFCWGHRYSISRKQKGPNVKMLDSWGPNSL